MSSHQHGAPLPDVVPERDSRVLRCYAEHRASIGLPAAEKRELIGSARHAADWLAAASGLGPDRFDIRLVDHFMCHECRCPSRNLIVRKPGRRRRQSAFRFLWHLLETGETEVPAEIEAGGVLAAAVQRVPRRAGIRVSGDPAERGPVPSLRRPALPVGHSPGGGRRVRSTPLSRPRLRPRSSRVPRQAHRVCRFRLLQFNAPALRRCSAAGRYG